MIHVYRFLTIPLESSFWGKAFYPPHTSGKQEAIWSGWAGWSLVSVGEWRPGLRQFLAPWPVSRLLGLAPPRKVTHEKLKWTRS